MRKIFFLCLISFSGFSQQLDTIVSHSNYEKLSFDLDVGDLSSFEVTTSEVKTENGLILKTSIETDTISILKNSDNQITENYSLILSKSNWSKLLFGKQCNHLIDSIKEFPSLLITRDKTNNKLQFTHCDSVSSFLLKNFTKRLDCINNSDDKFMAQYVIEWINDIDSCNLFINSYSSHLLHLFSLYDLLIPINADSLEYSIGQKGDSKNQYLQTLFVTKDLDNDGTSRISFTDEIPGKNSIQDQFINSLYELFSNYESDTKSKINEIRMKSLKSYDRSEIEISNNNLLTSYLRVIQSEILNSNLKAKVSYYNFKIERLE